MLKNELEVDGFATSRIPIPSPRSTKRVDVLRYVARPLARLAHGHHAEDGAVAVAVAVVEPVDEDTGLRKQKKRYKNRGLPFTVPKNVRSLWKGNGSETQTHHDWTTRQTTTAWSSGGCLASAHCGDWQSRLWDHQSHRRASTKASQENIR